MEDNPRLTVYDADARPFLRRTDQRYDLIIVDAYHQPYVPFSRDAGILPAGARTAQAGGILALNVASVPGDESLLDGAPSATACGSPRASPYAPMKALLATWMPRVSEIVALIGGHKRSRRRPRSQLDDAALRPLIDEMLHGADGTPADERAALFRMAWDFVGTTFAGRGFLYERFYFTSATRNRQLLQRGFDRTRADTIVDEMLAMASQPRKRERGRSR